MNYSNIFNPSSIEHSKIEFGKPQIIENKYVVINLWYKNNDTYENFFMQLFKVPVLNINSGDIGDIALDLSSYSEKSYLEDLDSYVVQHIKKYGLIKKYNLRNIEYKSMSGNNQCNFILTEKMNTMVFDNKKKVLPFNEYIKGLAKGNYVSVIFEVNSIVINITSNTIFINIVPKQIRLHNDKFYIPKITQLEQYAFLDCDDTELISNNDTNDIEERTLKERDDNTPRFTKISDASLVTEVEPVHHVGSVNPVENIVVQKIKDENIIVTTTNTIVEKIEEHVINKQNDDDDDLISSIMTVGHNNKPPATLVLNDSSVKALKLKKQPGRKKKN